ncbi:MAG: hypothetical protein IJS78_03720 [Clostridia bacterium]|nr:hypothetical protein [Clostridia bacterium]
MFGKKKHPELSGAWEEPGVIGTRIEIDGDRLTVLWRNSPVLETVFTVKEEDGGELLVPRKTGMRYAGASSDYAEATRLFYADGALEFEEFFPITGKSSTTLRKTDRSRYGNVAVIDGELKNLRGEWIANEYNRITFRGDVMTLNGRERRVHVVKSGDGSGPLRIIDADASVYEWEGMANFEFYGDRITASLMVCDAPPVRLEFVRRKD